MAEAEAQGCPRTKNRRTITERAFGGILRVGRRGWTLFGLGHPSRAATFTTSIDTPSPSSFAVKDVQMHSVYRNLVNISYFICTCGYI